MQAGPGRTFTVLGSLVCFSMESMARNQADASSDIDLLVLLNKPFDYFQELRTIVDLLYPLQMESERLISAKPLRWMSSRQGGFSSTAMPNARVSVCDRTI